MRTTHRFHTNNPEIFKLQLLQWAQQFTAVVWLDSNGHTAFHNRFNGVLAADEFTVIETDASTGFDKLSEYQQQTKDWIFGYLGYDLKNDTENLTSQNYDGLKLPDLYFFQPKRIIEIIGEELIFNYLNMVEDEAEDDFTAICAIKIGTKPLNNGLVIKERISKKEYLQKANKMLSHILRGDIYEANLCMEFYAEGTIHPLATFNSLNTISKAPNSAFLKRKNTYALCASPERYIRKNNDVVISQPIKGTAPRNTSAAIDEAAKNELSQNQKERAENVMIVDLVRNDLSKVAQKGSVRVTELCKVYSFEQVHQMISTVESKVSQTLQPVSVLKATFPMGSMTGAPKISAMKIIEVLEETKRGLYSGAIGYFTPKGDFDFNVVIRSIVYNEEEQYCSFSVGSAITAKADPELEYNECLLKAAALRHVLEK